jgi:hypothetical protein
MARTFNDLSDAELGQLLRSRYDRLCLAHAAGLSDEHPSESWARDTETLKAYREAAATGGIAGKVAGSDNPPDFKGEPDRPGLSAPPRQTQDGRYSVGSDSVPRFETSDGRVLRGNEALAARAAQANPSRAKRMALAIKGFDRLP